ncbi:MAG: hypothetical protein Q8L85_07640 [Alphaproteobacteria bacterium]|nr:hypothetical protein [Alphaproteobacteria bacterium]
MKFKISLLALLVLINWSINVAEAGKTKFDAENVAEEKDVKKIKTEDTYEDDIGEKKENVNNNIFAIEDPVVERQKIIAQVSQEANINLLNCFTYGKDECPDDLYDYLCLNGANADNEDPSYEEIDRFELFSFTGFIMDDLKSHHSNYIKYFPWIKTLYYEPGLKNDDFLSKNNEILESLFSNLKQLEILKTMLLSVYLKEGKQNLILPDNVLLMKNLEHLEIQYANLSDEEISKIAQLKKLKRLYLGSSKMSAKGIKELAYHLKDLMYLDISSHELDEEGIQEIKNFKNLINLVMPRNKINVDEVIKIFENLPDLRYFDSNIGTFELDKTKEEIYEDNKPTYATKISESFYRIHLGDTPENPENYHLLDGGFNRLEPEQKELLIDTWFKTRRSNVQLLENNS